MLGQEGSCAIALNPLAYPGAVVPPPEFNEYAEPPSLTAARHAEKWANNVDPVRGALSHSGSAYCAVRFHSGGCALRFRFGLGRHQA